MIPSSAGLSLADPLNNDVVFRSPAPEKSVVYNRQAPTIIDLIGSGTGGATDSFLYDVSDDIGSGQTATTTFNLTMEFASGVGETADSLEAAIALYYSDSPGTAQKVKTVGALLLSGLTFGDTNQTTDPATFNVTNGSVGVSADGTVSFKGDITDTLTGNDEGGNYYYVAEAKVVNNSADVGILSFVGYTEVTSG